MKKGSSEKIMGDGFFSSIACFMTALVVMQCSNSVLMLIGSLKGAKTFRVGIFRGAGLLETNNFLGLM